MRSHKHVICSSRQLGHEAGAFSERSVYLLCNLNFPAEEDTVDSWTFTASVTVCVRTGCECMH